MQYYPFDSRNPLYREKIGALAEGETLRLRLLLHRDANVYKAFLVLRNDEWDTPREICMTEGEWLADYRFYSCEITLTEGLYWYSFRYTSAHGEFKVTKTETSLGIVSSEGEAWQQTVYARDFSTPDWLAGGIIYQIFPDRFYSSGEKKQGIPEDRFICNDWYKQPEFRQPKEKCRLGNDYYGGDLKGITLKLDYLKELGVSCIYLNPIFEAHSNHRYNTADYMKIDPHLGTEADLEELICEAKKRGINLILDGVFSHTGDDSIYFNRYGRYLSAGAAQTPDSPYYSWYSFKEYPHKYNAWWDIASLPETNENDLSFSSFITGESGVLRYWLKKGIKGWRLDVADELPDDFLDKIRLAVKSEDSESYLLGEVWEDATNKISYGSRRRFLRGRQLDSVMNYPFANAIVELLKGGSGEKFINTVLSITENYPPQAIKLLMNHIGTHDTARILTRLGTDGELPSDREAQSQARLTPEQYTRGTALLKLAALLQFTLPGVPSVYYGDEAGLTGFGDPFCRAAYPWGRENTELLEFYRTLGKIRRNSPAFKETEFVPLNCSESLVSYLRKGSGNTVLVAVNCGGTEREMLLHYELRSLNPLLGNKTENGKLRLEGWGFALLSD
ncbi:MAG: glycoside hydrolase family 13 protein [Clostridia bacterium]|nr:glycoside hydrolase family 13 protein [Clostridia bacterium]